MAHQLEFTLDNGEKAYMQVQETQSQALKRVSRGDDDVISSKATRSFNEAVRCIAPIGKTLLAELKDMNTPDEIGLEFNISFTAEAGVVFTSLSSEASFKVNITWKNNKDQVKNVPNTGKA